MEDRFTLPPPCAVCGGLDRAPHGGCAGCGAAPADAGWKPLETEHPSPAAVIAGVLVAGKFEVEGTIGEGGAGRVYRAKQLGLDRPVALKLLHPHLAVNEEQKARFHREARAASRIAHPGAVTVYDFGVWEGQLYIALEYLPGRSLSELLDAEYPLSDHRIVGLLVQVADVLTEAHRHGVIHRDLKPENVMVSKGASGEDVVKVVDFGLAILYGQQTEVRLTQDGVITGTPAYMSPEQVRGEELDPLSDLYSLGVILYELLCGEIPFGGQNVTDVLMGHIFHPPKPPSEVEPDTPINRALERLALRTLAKSRFERPATVAAFRDALVAALELPEASPTGRDADPDHKPQDRQARADAAGLAHPPGTTHLDRPLPAPEHHIVVVERDGRKARSLSTLLRAHTFDVEHTDRLVDGLPRLRSDAPAAVVVDLTPDPAAMLDALAGRLTNGRLDATPVVVIGPEDDLALMTRALNLGLSHYVPKGAVVEKLPKTLARVLRRLRRKNPKTA